MIIDVIVWEKSSWLWWILFVKSTERTPIEHELFDKFLMHDSEASMFVLMNRILVIVNNLSTEFCTKRIFEIVARSTSSLAWIVGCIQRCYTSNTSYCYSILYVMSK